MEQPNQPMIVGAGPVGLGAALFLALNGHPTRIVETLREPSSHSKALAVSPRTLEILESTGVTAKMLKLGDPIRGAQFRRGETILKSLSFDGIHPKYPYMVALPQATTERLLADALTAAGGTVERGIQMMACRNVAHGVEVTLEPTDGGTQETVTCPWMLAADGSRSTARHSLGIDFHGSTLHKEWYLADARLKTELAPDHAHIILLPAGEFLFVVRFPDDTTGSQPGSSVWRVMGNRPDPLQRLVQSEVLGEPLWSSSFHIGHRIVSTMAEGNVYFAGDAAHIHSPVGARGMNLGLEDAWAFAQLATRGRLQRYNELRRPVDKGVVQKIEHISKVVSCDNQFYGLVRTLLFPMAIKLPFVQSHMITTVSGLDHPLPDVENG